MSDSRISDSRISESREIIDRRKAGALERHLQSLLMTVIAAGLLFAISYFYNDNKDKAVLAANVQALTAQVVEMRSEQRATQALLQSHYANKEQVNDIEQRTRALERVSK